MLEKEMSSAKSQVSERQPEKDGRSLEDSVSGKPLPREAVQDATGRCRLKKAHGGPENGKCHPFMELSGGLDGPVCISATIRHPREARSQMVVTIGVFDVLTSMLQNIHRMSVCTTTRAAEPNPKAK